MNQRIRLLAEQAGFYYTDKTGFITPAGCDPAKFAELIVRECISTVENLSPGYQDYRNQIEDAFRRDCVEQIKEHFGVEE